VLLASPARAEEAASARADLDGDGQPEEVALRPSGGGGLTLSVDGRELATEAGELGLAVEGAELRPVALARGQRAGVFRVPLSREGLAFEAVLLVRGGATSVVWSGITGLRGDRGTRWGDRVVVEDLTDDGFAEIVVAAVADEVPLCGVAQPELFPRALDPASGELRPVMLNRLRGLEVEETPLRAERSRPVALAEPPVVDVTSWAIASTVAGDGGVVEGLAAPRGLADDDRTTSWIEGRPGPGTGEFVTARLLPGPYSVKALALVLVPAAPPAPARARARESAALGRPRTLTLVLDGRSGLRRFAIDVPEDPAGFPGEPVWVTLPEPVQASCLSLVLGQVHGGGRPPGSTAVAEVAVFTDLDFEGGAERMFQSFLDGTADAEVLVRALGTRAIPSLAGQWPDLDVVRRRRATSLLADLEDAAAADLLSLAATNPDDATAVEARRGLLGLGEEALEALARRLVDEDAGQRAVIVGLIGSIGTPAALRLLLERLGSAPDEDRPALRRALSDAIGRAGAPGRQAVLERAEAASGEERLALMASLIPVEPDERDRFARIVESCWEEAQGFEGRYRVLTLASGGGAVATLQALAGRVVRDEEDRYLRAHAVEALGAMGASPSALAHLGHAAADEWAGVRVSVARALGRIGPENAWSTVLRLLTQDPWPAVRSAAAESAGLASGDRGLAPLMGALDDPSPLVQGTAARVLGELGRPEALPSLRALAEDDGAALPARTAAARALGAMCSTDARDALMGLVRWARERRSSPEHAQVAAAAIEVLVVYEGADVDALLIQNAMEGVPGLRMAAIEALGLRGGADAREALEAITEDPTPLVAAAAGAALRRLESGATEPRCPARQP
jgi:HEAT repeat protein